MRWHVWIGDDRMAPTDAMSATNQLADALAALVREAIRDAIGQAESQYAAFVPPSQLTVRSGSEPDRWISVDEVAALLAFSPNNVRLLARSGQLKGAKAGRSWKFRLSDVHNYMADPTGGAR